MLPVLPARIKLQMFESGFNGTHSFNGSCSFMEIDHRADAWLWEYGAMTTLSTSLQGAAGLAPPPRLYTSGTGSIWDPPHLDFPVLQQQQVTTPQYRPSMGRSTNLNAQLKAIQYRKAQGLQAPQSASRPHLKDSRCKPLGSKSALPPPPNSFPPRVRTLRRGEIGHQTTYQGLGLKQGQTQ